MNRYRWAARVAILTAALTFILICWGGIVHNTGSSLACPDWPLCHGQLITDTSQMTPDEKRQHFWEYGHRTIGAAVGLLAIALYGLLWRRPVHARRLRGASILLLALVCTQGALGGWTVLAQLVPAISSAHLSLSMLVWMLMLFIARHAWLGSRPGGPPPAAWPPHEAHRAFPWLLTAFILVYCQIVLGAVVRHTGATWVAGFGPEFAIAGRIPETGAMGLWSGDFYVNLNLLHRYCAVLVSIAVVACCGRVAFLIGDRSPLAWVFMLWLPAALVLFQVMIGIGMVAMSFPVFMRTLHLAVPALLLASLFWLLMELRRSALAELQSELEAPAGSGIEAGAGI